MQNAKHMKSTSSRPIISRVLDIAIATLLGGVLGATFSYQPLSDGRLHAEKLYAKQIIVEGEAGYVAIDGDHGISLNRNDYASAMLWFREPGTGNPGTGGPVLWINADHQAFKATSSGQEVLTFPDEGDDAQ
jgi:hypothetical protein